LKKLELAGENGIKTVYDLQSYWTSMAAILVSLGFTFLIDRMTEVLTPDIYIELTGLIPVVTSPKLPLMANMSLLQVKIFQELSGI
jgi:hypothetical protein